MLSCATDNWCRQQAVDEGGIPTMANTTDRKYIPGKPHPNMIELIGAVGSDLWLSNMMWSADKRPKYGMPEKLGSDAGLCELFQRVSFT